MSLFGGLKHEHKIYNDDFSSREEFIDWMDNRIDKLEEIVEKVNKCTSDNWDMIENNQLADDLEDTIENIIDELESSIKDLEDKKWNLKE